MFLCQVCNHFFLFSSQKGRSLVPHDFCKIITDVYFLQILPQKYTDKKEALRHKPIVLLLYFLISATGCHFTSPIALRHSLSTVLPIFYCFYCRPVYIFLSTKFLDYRQLSYTFSLYLRVKVQIFFADFGAKILTRFLFTL